MSLEEGETIRRAAIRVTGLVQGVGFRPFVYRVATSLDLAGFVLNTTSGVELEVEGTPEAIDRMVLKLKNDPPPLSMVETVDVEERPPTGEVGFRIVQSAEASEGAALVSPDMATCQACQADLEDPSNRRHRYPFVNCTDCGPRFTIVEGVPYDRHRTTMAAFRLCPDCEAEYNDPGDRRYHAEPNACPVCGPRLTLLDGEGDPVSCPDPLAAAAALLEEGRVLAIKGLGGYHLACDATLPAAVELLRARKGRPHRPLALMCRDLETAARLCHTSPQEEAELQSPRRSILLLRRRHRPGGDGLAPSVAPGLDELGIMLPYTPLHHLLLQRLPALVMTSGNRSGGPMVAEDREAVEVLGPLVDAILTHDRPIANRCDDSVARVEQDRVVVVRRSRGFVPLPVSLRRPVSPILALGAMLANTFCVAEGRRAFPSQHVGDTDDGATLDFLEEAVGGLSRWLGVTPVAVAHDLHPDLPTTRLAAMLADEAGARLVAVQHHLAHLASAVAAWGRDPREPIQALVLDGTGYGADGTIWGGELLVGTPAGARRRAHLLPMPLPGGEAAVQRPWRLAVGWVHQLFPGAPVPALEDRGRPEEADVVRRMVDRRFNTPVTSSAGRLFDVVSVLLGVRDTISYEGQAAIELEHLARGADHPWPMEWAPTSKGDRLILEPGPLLGALLRGLEQGADRAALALGFHHALAEAWAEACGILAQGGAPGVVALTGGVFNNRILTAATARGLERRGLEVLPPGPIPVGDGGISLGQVLVADAVLGGAGGDVEP